MISQFFLRFFLGTRKYFLFLELFKRKLGSFSTLEKNCEIKREMWEILCKGVLLLDLVSVGDG